MLTDLFYQTSKRLFIFEWHSIRAFDFRQFLFFHRRNKFPIKYFNISVFRSYSRQTQFHESPSSFRIPNTNLASRDLQIYRTSSSQILKHSSWMTHVHFIKLSYMYELFSAETTHPSNDNEHRTNRFQVMCVQYWPASKDKDEEYGGIGVSVLKEEELANFHIRTIRLYKKNNNDVSVLLLTQGEL